MERNKALEVTQTLYSLESAESFLDEVTSASTIMSDIPDEMYDALKVFAREWVEQYKQKLANL